MAYEMNPGYDSKVLFLGSAEYETCRQENTRGDTQDQFPQEIHIPRHENDVVIAVRRALALGTTIGIRAGGHNFSNPAIYSGLLVDLSHLNRRIEYDNMTHIISFGPTVQVKELAETLEGLDRFYPHGHCPSVASGGFLLGAGQGIALRGWGPTYRDWLLKIEVVVPDGRILTASRVENADLFWAARGGGPAFFGIVTKFWCKTIPRSKWWGQSLVFWLADNYRPLMRWFIQQSQTTPKDGTELNALISYAEKAAAEDLADKPSAGARLQFTVSNLAIADNEAEARQKLAAYNPHQVPKDLKSSIVLHTPISQYNPKKMWEEQNYCWRSEVGVRWRYCSMSTGSDLDLDQLLQAAECRLTRIPTLRSYSLIVIPSWEPDEEECAFSIPTQLYLGSFAGWEDPALTPVLDGYWRQHYQELIQFSSGMSPSDYDIEDDGANSNPLSATALTRFLEIRQRWDPNELFPTYKKYIITSEKMAAIRISRAMRTG